MVPTYANTADVEEKAYRPLVLSHVLANRSEKQENIK